MVGDDYTDYLRWHVGNIFEDTDTATMLKSVLITSFLFVCIYFANKFYEKSKDKKFKENFFSRVQDLIDNQNFVTFVDGKPAGTVTDLNKYHPENISVDLDNKVVFIHSNNRWRN